MSQNMQNFSLVSVQQNVDGAYLLRQILHCFNHMTVKTHPQATVCLHSESEIKK